MKILLAASLYPPETRGPATFAAQLTAHLEKRKASVIVVPFREVRALPPGLRHVVYFFKLLLRGRGVHTVVALDPVSTGLPALLASKFLRAPLVVRIGGDYAWEQGAGRHGVTQTLDEFVAAEKRNYPFSVQILWSIECFVARQAEKVVVPSTYLKQIVSNWGVSAEKISVIHSAALPFTPSLPREALRQRLGWGEEFVVFSIGELVPWKGFDALLGAVALLKKEIPRARLIIVGGGRQEKLRARAQALGFDPATIFLGELSHTVSRELLGACDLFVLNTGYEGLSHALIEAMQAGLPIVTTPVGGNAELIEQGKTGLLVPFNDERALAGAMKELARDPRRAAALGAAAHSAAEKFTAEVSMRAWEKLLKSI
jgi:glycosyltransferase involved in cell wall biosynthesis